MSATYKQLVDETLNTLHGVVGDPEQLTSLTQSITSGDTSFTVDDATQISRGLIEIGDELLWVKSVDRSTDTVSLGGSWARGYRSTTAASASSGDMIVAKPLFPRSAVKAAIQEVLQGVTPSIYAVATDETQTSVATQITYPVNADANFILKIEWQAVGPTGVWVPVRRWNFDPTADTTAFSTGKSVDIFDAMTPGRTIKVTYAKDPTALSADSDTLATAGLSEGMRDVLMYGACARLLAGPAAARLQTAAVEQSDRDSLVAGSDPINTAKFYMQMYLSRLADEQAALQKLYPIRVHVTR